MRAVGKREQLTGVRHIGPGDIICIIVTIINNNALYTLNLL